jgi:uncharacterized protein (TIGR02448 family)
MNMMLFKRGSLKRYVALMLTTFAPMIGFAHCDGLCFPDTETPAQSTQLAAFTSLFVLLSPITFSSDKTEESKHSSENKLVYSVQELESAHFYFASGGEIEDAYFTSALNRFRRATPDTELSDIAIAELIIR